jgi:hypothetical protein
MTTKAREIFERIAAAKTEPNQDALVASWLIGLFGEMRAYDPERAERTQRAVIMGDPNGPRLMADLLEDMLTQ